MIPQTTIPSARATWITTSTSCKRVPRVMRLEPSLRTSERFDREAWMAAGRLWLASSSNNPCCNSEVRSLVAARAEGIARRSAAMPANDSKFLKGKTSNIEHRTLNIELKPHEHRLNIRRSMFGVQCSMLFHSRMFVHLFSIAASTRLAPNIFPAIVCIHRPSGLSGPSGASETMVMRIAPNTALS